MEFSADGTVTLFGVDGAEASFGVSVLRTGERQLQQIFLKQADGKNWNGRVNQLAPGGVRALQFLDTQNARGPMNLLLAESRGGKVLDNRTKDGARVLTVRDQAGQTTHYFLDTATSRINTLEYVSRTSRDPVSGQPVLHVESYLFSDYRMTQGVPTPFRVEHFTNGVKREELQLAGARYSTRGIDPPAAPRGGSRQ
jgi:hypothetical protein